MNPVVEDALYRRSAAPTVSELHPGRAMSDRALPYEYLTGAIAGTYSEAARRLLNVTVAAIALIVLFPVLAVIALVIKLTSPGPVIYSQTRIGIDRRRPLDISYNGRRKVDLGGCPFTIYKFRTMRADPAAILQVWASPDDARVTPIGRFLRKTRLDELPQLFNVLRGDMNIVGPRPEQPRIFMSLRQQIQRYPERQRVLPGITGWAQVNQQYDTCIDDVRRKVAYDLEYIRTRSALGDLRILFRTIPVVIFRRGAW